MTVAGYLSSFEASSKFAQLLLLVNLTITENVYFESALTKWKTCTGSEILPENKFFQSEWDKPLYERRFSKLFHQSSDMEKARLLSISSESSSVWLNAIPIPFLGLHLDPISLKIACSLHLGSPLCHPHICICSVRVDSAALGWTLLVVMDCLAGNKRVAI